MYRSTCFRVVAFLISLTLSNQAISDTAKSKKKSFFGLLMEEAIGELVGKPAARALTLAMLPQRDAESVLSKVASKINKQMPARQIDENTIYVNATVGPGLRVNYNHKTPYHRLDQLNVADAKNAVETSTRNNFCRNLEGLAGLLDHGVTLHYIYRTSDNKVLIDLPLNRGSC